MRPSAVYFAFFAEIKALILHRFTLFLCKKKVYNIYIKANKPTNKEKTMIATIQCAKNDIGSLSFYLVTGEEKYFLFYQDDRAAVRSYFGNGLTIDEAYDYKKSNSNAKIRNAMEKLPRYIKYIESLYGICVLENTKKKGRGERRSKRDRIDADRRRQTRYELAEAAC